MKRTKHLPLNSAILFLMVTISGFAQTEVIRSINYKQVSNFESEQHICSMKISADGSTIVFGTSGPAVKVYTMSSSGSNLTEIYDFERTGFGPNVDISNDGDKIMWCDGYGGIFTANSDGSMIEKIATLIPNPNPDFADIEPNIAIAPRLSADGGTVFFLASERDPLAAGLYSVKVDGSNLKQLFSFTDVASEVFGSDASEYNYNTGFADGLDINWDGSRAIFGTRTYQIAKDELNKGDAIVWTNGDLQLLCDYATGHQPFSTYEDGDEFVVFRREYIPELEYDGINIYLYSLATETPLFLLGGYDQFSTSHRVQMAYKGSNVIVLGGMGLPYTPPITHINTFSKENIDMVSIDEITLLTGSFRMSESILPSITADGRRICYVATSIPNQIWVTDLGTDGIFSEPAISGVQLNPWQVMFDATTTSTFEAYVTTFDPPIQYVCFNAFKDGRYQFRAITSDPPYMQLNDAGTLGDQYADDFTYTNNTVRTDLIETPQGEYTIRIMAANATLREITAVDAEPFSIVDNISASAVQSINHEKNVFTAAPNPFSASTTLTFYLAEDADTRVEILDISGRLMKVLVDKSLPQGLHSIVWDGYDRQGNALPGNIYIVQLTTPNYSAQKKLILNR